MSTVPLPDGWGDWPIEAKAELRRILTAQAAAPPPFYCPRLDCDGEPHDSWTTRHARTNQRPPSWLWTYWLMLAGRGFGKTRIGAEWVWRKAKRHRYGALIGATAADARDVMVEGESGILAVCPPAFRPKYEPSKRRLTYPNGGIQTTFSADEPDRLRGPQHEYGWGDEWAAWKQIEKATDNLNFGLRLGEHPQLLLTTTPRPLARLIELLTDEDAAVTRGSTYDNLVNLAPSFRKSILKRYEGTSLGAQELHAEILDLIEGALWTREMLNAAKVSVEEGDADLEAIIDGLVRLVVGVDPAGTHRPTSDQTGIVVAGCTSVNHCPVCGPIADGPHGVIVADRSGRYTPGRWSAIAVALYDKHSADAIVAEQNFGGDMVKSTVRGASRSARYRSVNAARGKLVRAEPVAALYEQGRVHHLGDLLELEEQMRTWTPDSPESPDRMDAAVWALSDTMLGKARSGGVSAA